MLYKVFLNGTWGTPFAWRTDVEDVLSKVAHQVDKRGSNDKDCSRYKPGRRPTGKWAAFEVHSYVLYLAIAKPGNKARVAALVGRAAEVHNYNWISPVRGYSLLSTASLAGCLGAPLTSSPSHFLHCR